MNSELDGGATGKDRMNRTPVRQNRAPQFSFGIRRYTSTRAKRLFTPQKGLLSASFAPEPEQARAV
jgi:hypothetical protein